MAAITPGDAAFRIVTAGLPAGATAFQSLSSSPECAGQYLAVAAANCTGPCTDQFHSASGERDLVLRPTAVGATAFQEPSGAAFAAPAATPAAMNEPDAMGDLGGTGHRRDEAVSAALDTDLLWEMTPPNHHSPSV